MTYRDGQILYRMALILCNHAEITSGAYKLRDISHGTTGPEFTEEEKLAYAMQIIRQQTHLLAEFIENLPTE